MRGGTPSTRKLAKRLARQAVKMDASELQDRRWERKGVELANGNTLVKSAMVASTEGSRNPGPGWSTETARKEK